ncbi:MAG: tRNA (5-methylaminomethyl-2-thiouridine)(34)-methyltransferase MnmD [Winogradskyella sp.]|uniref:tRNA (5-methylaminomethyl-2-thiouridine)(34)-methyltransferase MnmD n=1 Tax=Winogradskyella sp. TaxID=1883156 RepID=UPI001856E03E|nr:tRNA (5-methylaminomethyl-2-thiouridine)(34)-methyltransferase MnmD [Winogradskyella sp.]MBT8245347.1 tRNA (5-methylaminomethyl-2-thiouridine)(34)-methyltransferase MnmD [Winogradskyella sp.]NNK23650.1 tRNA (5-methylaminomethyl-2-thiouridine)(34)-methyltransferase MnmD [Winogradskyella sp.]
MKRNIITTADGSKTIQVEDWNEQYHSIHGAINEANHVFLKHGLLYFYSELISKSYQNEISILEIGFGTGLNAFLTLIEAEKQSLNINYVGVEAYPVKTEEVEALNYSELISENYETEFEKLHNSLWEKNLRITDHFQLKKEKKFFKDITAISEFDIVYFDAFGARVQPDLWTETIFKIMYNAMKPNSVLTTYSAMGSARRAMQAVGFEVQRLEGPPNKRHMLRAIKR